MTNTLTSALRAALTGALAEQLGGGASLLFPRTAAEVAVLRVAGAGHGMMLLVIEPDVPNLDKAMLLTAIGVLAVQCAPNVRIAALDVCAGAEVEDVVAAAVFLATAESTTGQIVRITPQGR